MVSYLAAVLLGIIQGIAEWLPISSSGHLVIAQQLLGLKVPLLFNVVLHVATALVVIWFMRREVKEILTALATLNFKSGAGKWAQLIILGSIPTALLGFFLHDWFASLFASLRAVSLALIATGIFLPLAEFWPQKKKLNANRALWMGFAQGLAIIPGISRSGATIGTGLLLGVEKERAARFSFLLAIPAILGAGLYEATQITTFTLGAEMLVGAVVAAIVGYASLTVLLKIVVSNKLKYFAVYCFALGFLLFFI